LSEVNLKAARLERGLSVAEASAQIGVSPFQVRRSESGNMPRPAAALKIAKFYGYTVSQVWPEETQVAA
jgi:transcriptional regulator with XRE-family HTH domain